MYGIRLHFISSFLSNRTFRVILEEVRSVLQSLGGCPVTPVGLYVECVSVSAAINFVEGAIWPSPLHRLGGGLGRAWTLHFLLIILAFYSLVAEFRLKFLLSSMP